jgi:hypothetical protein
MDVRIVPNGVDADPKQAAAPPPVPIRSEEA